MYFKSPDCPLLYKEKVVLHTPNKNGHRNGDSSRRDGDSWQQRLLRPARARGRGLDMEGVKQTKEEAGSEGTEQIISTTTQQNQRYPQRVPPAPVGPCQDRDPVEFGKGKLCWFSFNFYFYFYFILLYFSDKDH